MVSRSRCGSLWPYQFFVKTAPWSTSSIKGSLSRLRRSLLTRYLLKEANQTIEKYGARTRPDRLSDRALRFDRVGATEWTGVLRRAAVESFDRPFRNQRSRLYTNSFFAPIRVRNRSANKAASNGFLNVSLMLERSKLADEPSSGSRAIKIVSLNSGLRRRF